MKISLYASFSDIISAKETLVEKANRLIDADEKHHMYRTLPINDILQLLKKDGVDGLELLIPSVIHDKDIVNFKNVIKKHNMSVFSIHQSNENFYHISLSEIQRLCDIANKFLAKVIVLHCDALGESLFDKDFVLMLKKLQEKHKLTFGIENMPKSPFSLLKTYAYNAKKFSSTIDNAGLSITFDTTHLAQVGSDICEFFRSNREKIINIHISDYRKSWLNKTLLLANNTHLPLTEGELNIGKFLKTLKENSYQGLITMEINANIYKLCQNAKMIKSAFV